MTKEKQADVQTNQYGVLPERRSQYGKLTSDAEIDLLALPQNLGLSDNRIMRAESQNGIVVYSFPFVDEESLAMQSIEANFKENGIKFNTSKTKSLTAGFIIVDPASIEDTSALSKAADKIKSEFKIFYQESLINNTQPRAQDLPLTEVKESQKPTFAPKETTIKELKDALPRRFLIQDKGKDGIVIELGPKNTEKFKEHFEKSGATVTPNKNGKGCKVTIKDDLTEDKLKALKTDILSSRDFEEEKGFFRRFVDEVPWRRVALMVAAVAVTATVVALAWPAGVAALGAAATAVGVTAAASALGITASAGAIGITAVSCAAVAAVATGATMGAIGRAVNSKDHIYEENLKIFEAKCPKAFEALQNFSKEHFGQEKGPAEMKKDIQTLIKNGKAEEFNKALENGEYTKASSFLKGSKFEASHVPSNNTPQIPEAKQNIAAVQEAQTQAVATMKTAIRDNTVSETATDNSKQAALAAKKPGPSAAR